MINALFTRLIDNFYLFYNYYWRNIIETFYDYIMLLGNN